MEKYGCFIKVPLDPWSNLPGVFFVYVLYKDFPDKPTVPIVSNPIITEGGNQLLSQLFIIAFYYQGGLFLRTAKFGKKYVFINIFTSLYCCEFLFLSKMLKLVYSHCHTCDIILDANREIWASKSYFAF